MKDQIHLRYRVHVIRGSLHQTNPQNCPYTITVSGNLVVIKDVYCRRNPLYIRKRSHWTKPRIRPRDGYFADPLLPLYRAVNKAIIKIISEFGDREKNKSSLYMVLKHGSFSKQFSVRITICLSQNRGFYIHTIVFHLTYHHVTHSCNPVKFKNQLMLDFLFLFYQMKSQISQ